MLKTYYYNPLRKDKSAWQWQVDDADLARFKAMPKKTIVYKSSLGQDYTITKHDLMHCARVGIDNNIYSTRKHNAIYNTNKPHIKQCKYNRYKIAYAMLRKARTSSGNIMKHAFIIDIQTGLDFNRFTAIALKMEKDNKKHATNMLNFYNSFFYNHSNKSIH